MADPPLVASSLTAAVGGTGRATPKRNAFVNPVCDRGADPWVLRWRGAYYYCRSHLGQIRVSRSEHLHQIGSQPGAVV